MSLILSSNLPFDCLVLNIYLLLKYLIREKFNLIYRENFIQKKLQFLYNSLTLNDLNAFYPVSSYLNWISCTNIAHNSTLLTTMLKQMDVLESCFGIKDSYLETVLKDFYLMSLNVIEFVNNEM